ncbi:5-methylcytosine restriction system specificity protein McrC [Mesoterricola sediminis]|uniref:5-methylcytosine-specific restriction system specificity protein McrC n=1 Tax=Mesoterricola sediminis TaxID=2927980 RepID=A0AA48GXL3_9BACT|nr:hypothetical protein [Mesoterricola sediminis]BDU78149.1 5-methylcytosine-specific restriction system specificity protein McrC [Mesoterricola sediminis]
MTGIPIRNLYYLLGYAWDLLEEAETWQVELENLPTGLDLLTRLILRGTQRLLRRGIDHGYMAQADVLTTIRGRIDFTASARRMLMERAKVQCDFEEFLPDLLHNRILKSTLRNLQAYPEVAQRQRSEVHVLLRRMEGITPLKIRSTHFGSVRLHRNNAHYALLMHLCRLVNANLLVCEETGKTTFKNFMREKGQMAKLFQSFVYNFYRKETQFVVSQEVPIDWDSQEPNPLLPSMKADLILKRKDRTIVVECKFYEEALQTHYLGTSPKLHSTHLYQLSTYLQHLQPGLDGTPPEGLLIYPATGIQFSTDLVLAGKRIRACTLDLMEPWNLIAEQMHRFLVQGHSYPHIGYS